MSGWLLVAIAVLLAALEVSAGLFLLRRPAGPGTGQSRLAGQFMIATAIPPFLVLVSLAFGLFGPIDGIETIDLYGR
jgi:hypothetical protein